MQNIDSLYELVKTVMGTPGAGAVAGSQKAGGGLESMLSRNTSELGNLVSLFRTQADAAARSDAAVIQNTPAQGQSGAGSTAGDVARTVAGIVTGGFVLNPVVSGLMKLFGGGGEPEQAGPLQKFALPAAIHLDAGVAGNERGIAQVDYGQNGLPRTTAAPATQITVQVNAMDSRSFLDHSDDIASAVRRAMLESSALNDVISEL